MRVVAYVCARALAHAQLSASSPACVSPTSTTPPCSITCFACLCPAAAGSHEYSFKVGQTVCTLRGHVLGTVAAWDTDTSMFVVNVAVDRTQQFVPGRRARVRLWSRARGGLCVGWDGGWL